MILFSEWDKLAINWLFGSLLVTNNALLFRPLSLSSIFAFFLFALPTSLLLLLLLELLPKNQKKKISKGKERGREWEREREREFACYYYLNWWYCCVLTGRPPQPPKRDPKTTLSVGRARARSMVIGLTEMGTASIIQLIEEYSNKIHKECWIVLKRIIDKSKEDL